MRALSDSAVPRGEFGLTTGRAPIPGTFLFWVDQELDTKGPQDEVLIPHLLDGPMSAETDWERYILMRHAIDAVGPVKTFTEVVSPVRLDLDVPEGSVLALLGP